MNNRMTEQGTVIPDEAIACPNWCRDRAEFHDYDSVDLHDPSVLIRTHVGDVPGSARIEIAQEEFSRRGAVTLGQLVISTDWGERLTADDARRMADALVRAADLVEQRAKSASTGRGPR